MARNKVIAIITIGTLAFAVGAFAVGRGLRSSVTQTIRIGGGEVADIPVSQKPGMALSQKSSTINIFPIADVPELFSFAVIGDTQRFNPMNPAGPLQKAVKDISLKNVSLVMTGGDLVSSCDGKILCEEKYKNWKSVMAPLLSKTYEVRGNHDRTGKNKADDVWRKEFNLPENGPPGFSEFTYSFDFENSHFVVLDSERPEEHIVNKTQRDWLEDDLSKNSKENTFVFFHEPAYPVSSKIGESLDAKGAERDALWEIFKKYGVTAVFNGHEHIASRRQIDGIYQFVFGNTDSFNHDLPKPGVAEFSYQGGHFAVVRVSGKKITVETYSIGGRLLDKFELMS